MENIEDYVKAVNDIWVKESEENKRNMAAEEEPERDEDYIQNLMNGYER